MLKISQFGDVTRIDSARTIAGRGYYWSTAYLIDGLLIDTGCAHSATELINFLDDARLVCIVNTHAHEDHIGANGRLQKTRKDLEVYAHPMALRVLENPREAQPMQLYRRIMWGWPTPSSGKPIRDGEWIETERFAFQVIYTPGHSPDHICLHEQKQGWLFTGDLFVGGKDRGLREGYHIWQIIASLKQVVELPLNTLFPGCARVKDNPKDALQEKIEYLEEMGNQVLEMHREGKSERSIIQALFGGPMWIELVTFGHFSRSQLVRSYLAEENLL